MNRDLNTSFSSSNLLCQETQQEQEACFSETAKESHHYKSPCSDNEDDGEYIENLVQRETTTDVGFQINLFTTKTWLKSARFDAIQWIFNTRETFGFQVHTAYLSVTYFDRFIATRSIDEGKMWAIPLLSIACLSLAAKMEEPKVPFLSEFHTKDYQFENKVIQRMELMVLTTLEWKMSSATPFCYLHYFIRKFHGDFETKGLIWKAIEFIIAIIKEMSLVDCRPSIIAAAAVLAALNGGLTRKAMEDKIGCISLWGSLQSEHIFSCYNMMVEIERRKCKTPKFAISPKYWSVNNAIGEVFCSDVSDGGGGGGIKRKLTFNHSSDQNSLSKKICRP